MRVLEGLKPEGVFRYFEEICNIPHGSYHERAISDYLVEFAKQHGYEVEQDHLYNVIMKIPASAGYEMEPALILQGHMDMVCEKVPDSDINMETDGLKLAVDGDYIYAKDTTLGGDDGIALAYMLAIADDSTVVHPPLEYIITVCEEVGMEGANGIDLSGLSGKQMLNLDSEEEGIFLTSCAGGVSAHVFLPVIWESAKGVSLFRITVSGLLGGHSGGEIDKERANAGKVLGRILYELKKDCAFHIYALNGGKKDNAIPVQAEVVIGIKKEDVEQAAEHINRFASVLKAEYRHSDRNISVTMEEYEETEQAPMKMVLDNNSVERILTFLMMVPDGVQSKSMSVPGLVETSLNLGIMELTQEHLHCVHSVRSSVSTRKQYVVKQLECLAAILGGTLEKRGEYPAWEERSESNVRSNVVALYEKMYGTSPVIEGIHAGLECGLLAAKIENLDCIAMGPDILDIHTTKERLSISSTKRVYEFLVEYLKQK